MQNDTQKDAQDDAHDAQDDAQEITPEKRRQQIIRILEKTPNISVLELSKIFSVSRSTISRDLKKLQKDAHAQDDAHAHDDTQNNSQNPK